MALPPRIQHLALAAVLMADLLGQSAASSRPSPPDERRSAVWSAFEWMVQSGRSDEVVLEYGSDFMEFYYELATSADDPRLARAARVHGRTLASRYVELARPSRSASEALDLISASSLAPELGVSSGRLARLGHVASVSHGFEDLYTVDPGTPTSDPDEICDAIISLHFARRASLPDGEALPWAMSLARGYVYGDPARMEPSDVLDQENLVSHVVYVLSDYGRLSLESCQLDDEKRYMTAQLPRLVEEGDVELASEFVDSLRILGLSDQHPAIASAIDWLLTVQNSDGSFGDPDAEDFYDRYHCTWTALNALRRFRFQGPGPRWPGVTCDASRAAAPRAAQDP